jgi:DUF3006 family protein
VPHYTVDRMEGKFAVLVGDDGTAVDLPRPMLPTGAREGSVLLVPVDSEGSPDWTCAEIDEAERERRLKRASETLDRLRRRDPGGDIVL